MSSTQVRSDTAIETPRARRVDMKLEVVVIPVSDVDRAKRFYSNLGWRLDADFVRGDEFRVVQFTPPGSSCSIHFGTGVTSAVPGSAQGLISSCPTSSISTRSTGRSLRGMGRTGTLQCRAPSRVQTTPQVDLKKISARALCAPTPVHARQHRSESGRGFIDEDTTSSWSPRYSPRRSGHRLRAL